MLIVAVFVLCLLLPVRAIAHPGQHQHHSLFDAVLHFLTEPDHLALLLIIIALAVVALRAYRRRSQ